jgi:hypothetical protein
VDDARAGEALSELAAFIKPTQHRPSPSKRHLLKSQSFRPFPANNDHHAASSGRSATFSVIFECGGGMVQLYNTNALFYLKTVKSVL